MFRVEIRISDLSNVRSKRNDKQCIVHSIQTNMVQKSNNEVEVSLNKPVYLYYMATRSEPCSPSDTLDSGTGSDLESSPTTNHVKAHQNGKAIRFSTTVNGSGRHTDLHHLNQRHHPNQIDGGRSDAYNLDSEESETSLSCDSLNSGESHRNISSPNDYLHHRHHHNHHTHTTIGGDHRLNGNGNISININHSNGLNGINSINGNNNTANLYISDDHDDDHHHHNQITKIGFLPHSLLRDIRDRSTNHRLSSGESDESASQVSELSENAYTSNYAVSSTSSSSSDERNDSPNNDSAHQLQRYADKMVVAKNLAATGTTAGYENDKYYNFHMNEYVLDIIKDDAANKFRDDDTFAGYKDIENGTSTIRSSKGTVRGVKNRVRNGIATFLQMQQSNVKVREILNMVNQY